MAFGYNIDQRKTNKRNHIIDLFRQKNILSKAEAKKLSGYSMDTIISAFNTLTEEGIIIPTEGEQKPKGRKASFYELNHNHSLYLGITFNQSGIYSSLVSISNTAIEVNKTKLDIEISKGEFLETLKEHIDDIISRDPMYKRNLKSIGLSIPGDIDIETGVLKSYSFMPVLNDVNFKEFILSNYQHHTPDIDHNINSMTSYLLSDTEIVEKHKRILFISARAGTANGFIFNRQIVTGHGEFGHIRVTDEGDGCVCGRTGCLDCYFSYKSFIDLLAKFKISGLNEGDVIKDSTVERMARYYSEGHDDLVNEFDKRFYYFAVALLDAINITAPDLVILSGELLKIYGDPVAKLHEIINKNFPDSGISPHFKNAQIIFKDFGTNIAAMGMAYKMINDDWGYYVE